MKIEIKDNFYKLNFEEYLRYVRKNELNLTLEEAADLIQVINPNQLQKIETGHQGISPDTMLLISDAYKSPELCNKYCVHKCEIGQRYTSEINIKELSGIILEVLSTLNNIEKDKESLIEITSDGIIADEEYTEFNRITNNLDKIANSVKSLQLWTEKMKQEGYFKKSK